MKTYEQAVMNQWVIAYHRMAFAKEEQKPCKCEDCQEHMAAMEQGPTPSA